MFKVNKNINHNGRLYAAGSEIKPSDPGFKDLKAAGHVEGEEAKASAPVEQPVEEKAQALIDEVVQEKPKVKKRK